MFNLFLKSKNRNNLLKIFFNNPEKEFYIRQLGRMIKTSPGNVQKELKKLERDEILKSTQKGNMRFFSLNKSHPLKNELESIISKTIGIEAELKVKLKNLKNLKFAFIFGSYVKGDFKADSDIDVFVIGDIVEDELIKKIKKAEGELNREINFHTAKEKEFLKNLEEKSFYKEIIKNHILLTDNRDEFTKFINRT